MQTLPEREGDPEPPPDNGQHIALGCFTEYLRFLDRIGEGSSYRRLSLELPVIAGDGRTATIGRSAASFLRYHHLSIGDRLRVANAVRRLPQTGSNEQTFGALLSELGCPDESIEGFWDVFIRPALNLRSDEVSAEWGVFTVRTALLATARRATSSSLRARWAGCTAMPPVERSRQWAEPCARASASPRSTTSTATPWSLRRHRRRRRACSASPIPAWNTRRS